MTLTIISILKIPLAKIHMGLTALNLLMGLQIHQFMLQPLGHLIRILTYVFIQERIHLIMQDTMNLN